LYLHTADFKYENKKIRKVQMVVMLLKYNGTGLDLDLDLEPSGLVSITASASAVILIYFLCLFTEAWFAFLGYTMRSEDILSYYDMIRPVV